MARRDILLNEDGSFMVAKGDFVVGESDTQHMEHILKAAKGDYRETPFLGVDAVRSINSTERLKLQRNIESNFALDGYTKKVTVNRDFSVTIED